MEAQRARDLGLVRVRRLTWLAAAGAVGLTAAGSAIAFATIPGRAAAETVSTPQSTAPSAAPNPDQGSSNPPIQPQPGGDQGPAVVSGGS